jgi:hypothetical protein
MGFRTYLACGARAAGIKRIVADLFQDKSPK